MRTRWVICLMLLVASGSANSADMVGQASIIDGDTLEIHGSRIRLWGIGAPESSQLCRGDDSLQYRCDAKTANDLDAFIAGRAVTACQSRWTDTAAQWRRARSAAQTSGIGSCAMVSLWTGRNIPSKSTMMRNVKPSRPGEACGKGAISSPGFSASASGKAGSRVNVRMTPTPILENKPQGRSNVQPL
jgi:hypothetical protein